MTLHDSENTFVLGVFLCLVALVAAAALALVSGITKKPIERAKEKNRNAMLKCLNLPKFDRTGSSVEVGERRFSTVSEAGRVVGFVGEGKSKGYGGDIEAMVGFSPDGRITGVQILKHKETPGLGANVCDRTFKRTILNLFAKAPDVPGNDYLDQFAGRPASGAGNWRTKKDGGEFIYHTGATVTSRAVVDLVNGIASDFAKSRKTIEERSK